MKSASDDSQRILVIEDSATTRLFVRRILESEAMVIEASDGEEGLLMCRVERPDLILLDVSLPGADGFETLKRLKADFQTSGIPVIFLSAMADTKTKVRGLDLGAVDFVTKPFEPIDLRARVRVALRIKTMQNLLEQRAHIDALTGLANRYAMNDRLLAECRACRVRGVPLAALVIDLDRFKSVNDRLGHPQGDALLKATARALLESIRDGDFVARHGGDEFVVIAPDCDRDGASALGHRIRYRLGLIRELMDSVPVAVTASVGVCVMESDEVIADLLLRRADAALYQAKGTGRDTISVFQPNETSRAP